MPHDLVCGVVVENAEAKKAAEEAKKSAAKEDEKKAAKASVGDAAAAGAARREESTGKTRSGPPSFGGFGAPSSGGFGAPSSSGFSDEMFAQGDAVEVTEDYRRYGILSCLAPPSLPLPFHLCPPFSFYFSHALSPSSNRYADAASGPLHPGDCGVVAQVSGGNMPYRVEFNSRSYW